jgi:hypothetical protein
LELQRSNFAERPVLGSRCELLNFRSWPTLVLLVLSHWVLDVIVHRPDLPLAPGSDFRLGLGLWNSVPATLAAEFILFAIGAAVYLKSTIARDRIGSIGTWVLLLFLPLVELANVLGPPPPSVRAVTWSAQALWLVVAWGYWVDHHRDPIAGERAPVPAP